MRPCKRCEERLKLLEKSENFVKSLVPKDHHAWKRRTPDSSVFETIKLYVEIETEKSYNCPRVRDYLFRKIMTTTQSVWKNLSEAHPELKKIPPHSFNKRFSGQLLKDGSFINNAIKLVMSGAKNEQDN